MNIGINQSFRGVRHAILISQRYREGQLNAKVSRVVQSEDSLAIVYRLHHKSRLMVQVPHKQSKPSTAAALLNCYQTTLAKKKH